MSVLFITGFFLQWYLTQGPLNFLDTGFIANASLRIAHGETPYRDFFSLLTPLHFMVHGLLARLFGPHIAVFEVSAAVVGATSAVLAYLIAREIMSVRWAIGAWALAITFLSMDAIATGYAESATACAMAALYGMLRARRASGRGAPFAAGVAAAAAFWTKQTLGVYCLIGLLPVLLIGWGSHVGSKIGRAIGPFLAGLAAVSIPILLYIGARGGILRMIEDTVTYPATAFRREADQPPPSIRSMIESGGDIEQILYFLVVISAVIGVIYAARVIVRTEGDKGLAYIMCCLCGMLLITMERYSFLKFRCVLPLTAVVWTAVAARAGTYGRIGRMSALGILVVLGVACAASIRDRQAICLRVPVFTIGGDRIRCSPSAFQRLSFGVDFMRQHKGANIAAMPMSPLVYFYSGVPNPTRNDLVIPANLPPDDVRQLATFLTDRADYVIFDEWWKFDDRPFRDYCAPLQKVLDREYHVHTRGPHGVVVYERDRR